MSTQRVTKHTLTPIEFTQDQQIDYKENPYFIIFFK